MFSNLIYVLFFYINYFYHLCLVTDMDGEDLLSYFDSAYEFIKNGQEKSSVLVHW